MGKVEARKWAGGHLHTCHGFKQYMSRVWVRVCSFYHDASYLTHLSYILL